MSKKTKTKGKETLHSTVAVTLPEPTAEEQRLLEINVALAESQLAALLAQGQFQAEQFELLGPVFDLLAGQIGAEAGAMSPEEQEQLFRDQFDLERQAKETLDELLAGELERIRAGGSATPEQRELIEAAVEAGIEAGESDINQAMEQGLQMLSRELSPRLGLRPSDTPVVERGARIVSEGVRQKGQLQREMRGEQARMLLEYPLQSAQVYGNLAQQQQRLQEQTRQFQANLRQMAFNNRLALTGQVGTQGLQLASIGNAVGALSAAQAPRLSQPTTTTDAQRNWEVNTKSSGGFLGTAIQGLSLAGKLAGGIGEALSGGGWSGGLKGFGSGVNPPTVP